MKFTNTWARDSASGSTIDHIKLRGKTRVQYIGKLAHSNAIAYTEDCKKSCVCPGKTHT